ncbi:protoporphyrinogen oxidase [Thrips palmi]|uniref:Protoporphyrinogen oxidase n=1 Tax=Thrips palmi TaxID=161013 RepID=A0A6P8ZV46_THRPL|nr:protoporphyrinogen oxidase [Thrips palmi]XP_034249193.1 protoporphyrinogen oxidase [Thrips palmi]
MQAILGGGISGLSAAHYLLKSGSNAKVLLFEGGGRVGGWIWTAKQKNGLLFEQGPRTIRPRFETGLNTLRLVEELGISNLVTGIPSSHPTAKNRMIFVNGKLHALPSSLPQIFLRQAPFSKPLAAALLHDMKAAKKTLDDESIYSFVERRLGRELAEYAISPMICGICAGDAKEISVKFLMKSLFEWEQTHGSITKGLLATAWKNRQKIWSKSPSASLTNLDLASKAKQEKWSVWSLKGGLEVLPQTLLKSIQSQGAEVELNSCCSQIDFNKDGALLTIGNKKIQAKNVISTVPAQRLALLVERQHPILSRELSKIPCVTVAVVNLAFKGKVLNYNAFGFLIPPSENKPILGVIFDSCSFPQEDFTVLTVMMGGHWFESRLGPSPSTKSILNTAVDNVRSILKISDEPCDHHVSVLKDCIPQYIVGHYERVERIRDYIRKHKLPLFLAGSSFDGVGVNDVIFSAKKAALMAL